MNNYFRNLLNIAKENNVNVVDLDVASTLTCSLNDKGLNKEVSDEQFEEACSTIKAVYLKYDELTVWSVVQALLDIIESKEKSFNNFDFDEISYRDLGYKASYYL